MRAGGKDTDRGRAWPASFELRRGLEPEDNVGVARAWEMPGVLDNVSAADCEAVRAMVRADPTYRAEPAGCQLRIGKVIAVVLGSTSTARPTGEAWRRYYNEDRPHGAIGRKPPISLQNPGGAPSPPS